VKRASIPAGDDALIQLELLPALGVLGGESFEIVAAIAGVVATEERQQSDPADARFVSRAAPLEVERKRTAVARTRGVRRAPVIGPEQETSLVALREHHQAPPLAELDEALRLAGHVHLFG